MTRTEVRLADALDAAARALREDTLRPLLVPRRLRRRAAWIAPAAAAASLLLVVGVAAAVAGYLPESGRPSGATPPPRYYVEADRHGDLPVVRSTATGQVTARVQVPHLRSPLGPYLVTTAANGLFFTVVPAATGVRIYRFRLTAAGRVSSLRALPRVLPGLQMVPTAVAASPDGSRVAVALNLSTGMNSVPCGARIRCPMAVTAGQDDRIDVMDTATGATSVWQGGIARNYLFSVTDLSWTGSGNELVYYGEWCPERNLNPPGSGGTTLTPTSCQPGTGTGGAKAEVWALDPASGGGSLTSGHRLFSLSAAFLYLPQVLISPDGTTLTAVALTGRENNAVTLEDLSVEQISVATGKLSGVLYNLDLRRAAVVNGKPAYPYPITLSADAAGQHWMLSSGFCDIAYECPRGLNGWIERGQLVALQPADGSVASEAW